MTMKRGFFLGATFFAAGALTAGVYIVPKEYDNTYNSIKSKAVVVITNKLPTLSDSTKTLAGKKVHYRCVQIDKIPCRAGSPDIVASVTDISLVEPMYKQLLPVYGYEVTAEDKGTKWNICGGAAGGFMWDTSRMTSQKKSDGTVIIGYEYIPNTKNKKYLFFTDQANKGDDSSFMLIDVQQKCL